MKLIKRLIIPAGIFLLLAVSSLIFYLRSPVLIIIDTPFAALYGVTRAKIQQVFTSLLLFRQVKPVIVADSSGDDVIAVTINEISNNPFCVIFPRYFAAAAERYHADFPQHAAVLLAGTALAASLPSSDESLFIYRTDAETDLYRAGLMSGLIAGNFKTENAEEQKIVVLWQDRYTSDHERECFSSGVAETNSDAAVVFISKVSELPDTKRISCSVLTSAGYEYIEKNIKAPLILFTWLDPAIVSRGAFVLFDDSPWALVIPAVKMAGVGQTEGKIPSSPLVFSGKIADNGIFRTVKKAAKKPL